MMEGNEVIIVYGTNWCFDCKVTKRFLDRRGVEYVWVDIDEDHSARALVERINGGNRSVPTIVFPDGSTLTEPSKDELAEKLGLAAHA